MWLFGLLAMYLVVNTLYLTGMALCPMQMKIDEALKNGKSVITVFTDGTFGPIVSTLEAGVTAIIANICSFRPQAC